MTDVSTSYDSADDLTFLEVAAMVLRRRWFIVGSLVLFSASALAVAYLRPRPFQATSTFVPSERGSSTSGLAAQFGIVIGGAAGSATPDFYARLLRSEAILRAVVRTTYEFEESPGEMRASTLIDLFDPEPMDPVAREIASAARLREEMAVSTEPATGIVTLTVPTPWPELSERVNRRFLDLVNEFDLQQRQSLAQAERLFVEARMEEAGRELSDAEEELRRFLDTNREYRDSPRLAFEAGRLERQVDLRAGVFATLAQAYEQARIDEVRDTPVITVIDVPETSARRRRRATLLFLAVGVTLGSSIGLCGAVLLEVGSRESIRQADLYGAYATERDAAVMDLRSLAKRIPVIRRRFERP